MVTSDIPQQFKMTTATKVMCCCCRLSNNELLVAAGRDLLIVKFSCDGTIRIVSSLPQMHEVV
jgi:hypothetical protein